MAIKVSQAFQRTSANPIDETMALTKAEMRTVNDNTMPTYYFTVCQDDGKFYVYDKSAEFDEETGKFRELETGTSITIDDELSLTSENPVQNKVLTAKIKKDDSMVLSHDSFISYLLRLSDRVDQLEKSMAEYDVFARTCLVDSAIIKENILPDHVQSKFCRALTLTYSGTWSGDSYETVKINNKIITFNNDIALLAGGHTVKFEIYSPKNLIDNHIYIKKVFDEDTAGEASVVTQLTDTFVLTIEVATGSDAEHANLSHQLIPMEYRDVDLDYPYPVLELRDGSVIYRENLTGTVATDTNFVTNGLGGMFDIYACYNLGNTATTLSHSLLTKYQNSSRLTLAEYEGCEYVYMANWQWLNNCTSLVACLTTISGDTGFGNYKSAIKKVDFSKIRFRKLQTLGVYNILYGLNVKYIADDIIKVLFEEHEGQYNEFVIDLPFIEYLCTNYSDLPLSQIKTGGRFNPARNCNMIKTLGDLSTWDVSRLNLSATFSGDYFLEYVGDLSTWRMAPTITSIANTFKGCFNLRSVGDLSNWNTGNCTSFAWIFESCNYLGDEELAFVANWDVSKGENFRGVFCYLYESGFAPNGAINQLFDSLHEQYPPAIVNKRVNLSFVEDWDMGRADRLMGFFANNPYLTNAGDLRKWNLANPAITTQTKSSGYGFTDFLLNCSALETFKMPSIPRGTIVDDIVKGCTSLANIELDELNVAAISFADCPLTKTSVLNLINAATADVEITLKADVYTAVSADVDVLAAIDTKHESEIEVMLVSA